MTLQLSVVIPVFNEEDSLSPLWERLHPVMHGLDEDWELIFVNDGSTDSTLERLRAIRQQERRVRVLKLNGNHGQTAALDAGFRGARGEWVLTLDADLQNPPEEIPRLIAATAGVDLVYGRRVNRQDSWITRLSSRIGNGVRNLITRHKLHDTGCSLKIYRREALSRIPRLNGMHRFLPTLFEFHGFKIREIEVSHERRMAGISKYGISNRAWRGLLDCFAVRWMRGRALSYRSAELENEDENI